MSVYELIRLSAVSSRQGEIHRVQIFDLCDGCISLSNAEGLTGNFSWGKKESVCDILLQQNAIKKNQSGVVSVCGNMKQGIVLLATLYTSLFFVFSQIKIRYSIKYSDALSVRLFYTVPSVIIYEFLLIIRVLPIFDGPPCYINKRSRNLSAQSLVSCFPLHHMCFPICKQYYDNLIC